MATRAGKATSKAALKKGARIVGSARAALAADMLKQYEGGTSIRALADSAGRSYGFVHRLLAEQGATFRARGGATRGSGAKNNAKGDVKSNARGDAKKK